MCQNSPMHAAPFGGSFGAEIHGLDLTQELDDPAVAAFRAALVEHQVLLIHEPGLTANHHMAFGSRLGSLETHFYFPNLGDGYEQVSVLDSEQKGGTATVWHTDGSYLQPPMLATMTYAKIMPEVGGNTLFANMIAAYEALSPDMKTRVSSLSAVHDSGSSNPQPQRRSWLPNRNRKDIATSETRNVHPVVRRHPASGAQVLYVNPQWTRAIVSLSPRESAELLDELYQHSMSEEFTYCHQWRAGDLLIWDNQSTWHKVLDDFTGQRLMHRVSILSNDQI